jgi:hypothetical protein
MGKSELPEGRSEPGLGKRVANPLSLLRAMSMGESGAGVGRNIQQSNRITPAGADEGHLLNFPILAGPIPLVGMQPFGGSNWWSICKPFG